MGKVPRTGTAACERSQTCDEQLDCVKVQPKKNNSSHFACTRPRRGLFLVGAVFFVGACSLLLVLLVFTQPGRCRCGPWRPRAFSPRLGTCGCVCEGSIFTLPLVSLFSFFSCFLRLFMFVVAVHGFRVGLCLCLPLVLWDGLPLKKKTSTSLTETF